MQTLLLNVFDENVRVMEINDELDEYYKLLNCSMIDIVSRKIGGKWFDIVCDDEGLLKDDPKISAINDMGEPMLVGNLIFLHNDGYGEMVGLDDADIKHLKDHIEVMCTVNHPFGYPMLTQCEYC